MTIKERLAAMAAEWSAIREQSDDTRCGDAELYAWDYCADQLTALLETLGEERVAGCGRAIHISARHPARYSVIRLPDEPDTDQETTS